MKIKVSEKTLWCCSCTTAPAETESKWKWDSEGSTVSTMGSNWRHHLQKHQLPAWITVVWLEKKEGAMFGFFTELPFFLMHNNTIIINTKAPDGWKYCLPYIWSLHRLTFYALALRRSNRGDVSARHVSRRRVWTWGRGSICSRQPLTAHSAETVSAGGLRHWSCPRAFV